MKISEIPFEERPREKAIINGIETLSNIELLAIIIRSGTRNKSAIELSFEVFNHFKNINNLMNSSLSELKKIKGLDNAKSISILASLEFAKRCTFIKKEKRQHIDNSKDIQKNLVKKYRNNYQFILKDKNVNIVKKLKMLIFFVSPELFYVLKK